MRNRREFLISTAALILPGIAPTLAGAASAARKPVVPVRFTKAVRDATRALSIPSGRWKMIVAHHSAVKHGNAAIYDRAHRIRGMENGLAYHFLIGNGIDSGDGQIEVGSRWLRQIKGGHVRQDDVNEVAIGVCLVGNFEVAKPTKMQLAAFQELMAYLRSDVTGRHIRFMVHREVDPGRTACPGRNFPIKAMHRLYG